MGEGELLIDKNNQKNCIKKRSSGSLSRTLTLQGDSNEKDNFRDGVGVGV